MATINVNSSVTDQFYRYKMPRLIAKVEGKGNGIKTVIVNMVDIAKSLSRPPTYPTKYFGCELGAQTYFDFKNERYIVNGSHDSSKLQSLLDGFIKKFVLCAECGNPETNLVVKSYAIKQRCIACGYQDMVDMRHKLTTFIVKNPPDQDPAASTPSKKDKIKAKKDSKKKDSGTEPDSPAGQSKSAQEEMAAKRASGAEVDAPPEVAKDDDDDWVDDVTDEAIKQRMEELSDAAKGLALTDDLDKTPQERLDLFYQYVKKEKIERCNLSGADKDILTEAERLEIKDKAPLVLVELLLSEKILAELKEHRILFLRFNHNNQKAQKYMMGGLEQLIGKVHKDALLPKVPHIFKALYDMDIMDEEVLIDWSQKVSKKYVSKEMAQEIHNKAAPFIKWLQEAEETESEEEGGKEEEEEEEDLAVVYSTTEKIGTHKLPNPDAGENEADDDFDIDAI